MTESAPSLFEALLRSVLAHWQMFLMFMLLGGAVAVAIQVLPPRQYLYRTVLTVGSRLSGDQTGVSESTEAVVSRMSNVHLPAVRMAFSNDWANKYPLSIRSPRGSDLIEMVSTGPEADEEHILALHRACAERAVTERRNADDSERASLMAQLVALDKQAAHAETVSSQLDRREAELAVSASRAESELERLTKRSAGIERRRDEAGAGAQSAVALAAEAAEAERLNDRLRFFEGQIYEQIPRNRLALQQERQALVLEGISREQRRSALQRIEVGLSPMKVVLGPVRVPESLGMGKAMGVLAGICAGIMVAIGWLSIRKGLAELRSARPSPI